MKALSILQPYAWLIVNALKDIENRDWRASYRGHFLVHAGKRYSRRDHDEYAEDFAEDFGIILPAYEDMPRGGVVGQSEIIDCVQKHPSRWKMEGSWGMVLANSKPLTFTPYRGQLGFFSIPREIVAANQPTPSFPPIPEGK